MKLSLFLLSGIALTATAFPLVEEGNVTSTASGDGYVSTDGVFELDTGALGKRAKPQDWVCSQLMCGTPKKPKACPIKLKAGKSLPAAKPYKPKGIPKLGAKSRRSVEQLYRRFVALFARTPGASLTVQQLKTSYTRAKNAQQERTGTHRLLLEGLTAPIADDPEYSHRPVRTPNDQIFDAFQQQEFYRTTADLTGCTTIAVASPRGIFTFHFWEGSMKEEDAFQRMLENIAKGQPDKRNELTDNAWLIKNQYGLTDYAADKVAPGAWTDITRMKIAVFTPNKLPLMSKSDARYKAVEVLPQNKWDGANLLYAEQVLILINKIKNSIDLHNALKDEDITLAAYTRLLDEDDGSTNGFYTTMTAYFDGNDKYAIYGADKKIAGGTVSSVGGS